MLKGGKHQEMPAASRAFKDKNVFQNDGKGKQKDHKTEEEMINITSDSWTSISCLNSSSFT